MGRVSKINKRTLVSYDKVSNISRCLICQKSLMGYVLGNIKRHYECVHKHKFEDSASSSTKESSSSTKEGSQFNTNLNKSNFIKCCVGLVAVKNIPFQLFDDEDYFKRIIEPYEKKFNLQLDSENIVEHVAICANSIKDILKQKWHKKMLCLKIDFASRMGKSILSINIQYILNYKIMINTIGMIQLEPNHTAQFLKDEILKYMQDFSIPPIQIYSTTTNNGITASKAPQLLQQDILETRAKEFEILLESDLNDYEAVHERLQSLLDVVRCPSHAIQLVANDAFDSIQIKLEECRQIVSSLRTNTQSNRSDMDLRMPTVDNNTRWISTFDMLESLLSLKQHIVKKEVEISNDHDVDWSFIEEFVAGFTPLALCSQQLLLTEQYVMGDFYRDWLVCEAKLKRMDENIYAALLLESMQKRKEELLANDAFLAAIYFDPRLNFYDSPFITDKQKKKAVAHILQTHGTQNLLNEELNSANPINDEQLEDNDRSLSSDDPFNILEEELTLNSSANTSRNTAQSMASIGQKIDNLANGQRMAFATDVLDYWKTISVKDRDLYNLAQIILAVPASPISVERIFSMLSTITEQGSKLSRENINNLLLVKLNSYFIENVKF